MITAVCAGVLGVLGVLLAGSGLADRWRGSRSERAWIAEITASLDRSSGWCSKTSPKHVTMFCTETAPGNDESRAFITARERAPGSGSRTRWRCTAWLTGSSGNGTSNR
ncbi:hypothetical protein [Rhodococcus wratislaviensis]|uniref:Uncharacterized protein n=1 Tax=Rhodococcus wratislaviensis NBRC 100605 TaxID=1219028 RepID=X0PUN4_RHOWR|nr:hypothetical protein [Rhodococcus wratislaviensis]GAF46863.1 hypothetical protein RW1_035_00060 [Rhodococcus wratislaviensis NBRC 100605]